MGRVGNDEQQVQETIDDSFPENEQPVSKPRSKAPAGNNKSQSQEEEEDLYYVSSQTHQPPANFPPQNSEFELPNHQHAPPPANMHFAHHAAAAPVHHHAAAPPVHHHGVHMGQPAMAPSGQPFNVNGGNFAAQNKPWKSGLFDCMNDPENDEVASPHIPLPAVASNIIGTLARIRASVDQICFEQIRRKDDVDRLRDTLLMHIREIEKKSTECFDELDRVNRASRIDSQDIRTILSLDIRSSQKQLSA
ncbi:hypothetical protein F511_22315 [Dorcoceras hygrometricum]|uniref:Uncharacterized protein n=1 Tax=Dorcoceras hygrometricum TaxID=472368 RepID=A0A2Z7DB79_9LAMI|nr:hypothetical protein F511_22315 [Dorcoceras hygrometricum]